jgi:hypothetical protein
MVALQAPVPFRRTQYVVAALGLTVRVVAVVVEGDNNVVEPTAPVPHSYTEEPSVPPEAVNVAEVAVPLHIVPTFDVKVVGAVGGVEAAIEVVTPPVVVALHAPVPTRRTQYVVEALSDTERVAAVVVAGDSLLEPSAVRSEERRVGKECIQRC